MGPGPAPPSTSIPVAAEPGHPEIPGQTQSWAHWQELLDGPTPNAADLKDAWHGAADGSGDPTARTRERSGSLNRAITRARAARSGPEPEWPDADRLPGSPEEESSDEGSTTS